MNSGAIAERVHAELKRRIMNHEFRPGDRLDPALLAVPMASSVTPIRDALHLLTGEGLVETRTSVGFQLPALDEPALKDLYKWSAELLSLAIRAWPRGVSPKPVVLSGQDEGTSADRTAGIFHAIARHSPNGEHARAVDRLNARLHAIRTVEHHVIGEINDELAAWTTALTAGERGPLRRLSTSYHGRRRRAAAGIVRAMYRHE